PQSNSVAFWLGTPAGDFIVLQSFDKAALSTALHEYTHLIVGRAGRTYPLWLSEGLAGFYSTMAREGSKLRIGPVLPHAVEALDKGGGLIPLPALFTLDDDSLARQDPQSVGQFYAESWALTHMLLSADTYRRDSAAALAAIAGGQTAADALQAI